MTKRVKISRSDFHFLPVGRGVYVVKYTSPVTFRWWQARINDMQLLYAIMYVPFKDVKVKDLEILKRKIKDNYFDRYAY